MSPLSSRDADRRRVLRTIVERRRPDLVPVVDDIGDSVLGPATRDLLQEILVGELTDRGLDGSDEPTGYGLVVEDLIDWIGRV